jgi:hypothetical protein
MKLVSSPFWMKYSDFLSSSIPSYFLFMINSIRLKSMATKVIKMDVTCPFCIKHPIDLCLNTLVLFIKTNAIKFSFSMGYPLNTWQPKMDLVIAILMIENEFDHHSNDNQIFLSPNLW